MRLKILNWFMKKIKFFAQSIQGRRGNNEDAFLSIRLDQDNILLAVADGMGGAAAGEVASHIAIHTLQKYIKERLEQISENADFKEILFEAYHKIQTNLHIEIEKHPEYQGMGTTLSVLWVYKTHYVWANLGDSRIYHLNNKHINQITRDHTFIQDFEDKNGTVAPPEMVEQYGNYITRTLDGGNDIPDLFPKDKAYQLLDGSSAFLLCSDGLIVNNLESLDNQIQSLIRKEKSVEKACDTLVRFAYDHGSSDNITVVLAEYGKVGKRFPISRKLQQYALIGFIAIMLLLGGFWVISFGLIPGAFNLKQSVIPNKKDALETGANPAEYQSTLNTRKEIIPEDSTTNKVVKSSTKEYPKYHPFTPGKKGDLKLKSNATLGWTFIPYEGIPKETISRYENRIVGRDTTVIVNKDVKEEKVVVFGKEGDLKLSPGKYVWHVNVITNSGDVIEGIFTRNIEVVN